MAGFEDLVEDWQSDRNGKEGLDCACPDGCCGTCPIVRSSN